ncbi:MAG: serine hydrolase [Bulleidia sp.]
MKGALKGELHQIRKAFRGLIVSGGLYLICLVISETGVSAAPAAVINSQPAEQVSMTMQLRERDDITLSMLEDDLDALIDSDEIEVSDGITLDEQTQEALSDAVTELEESGYSVSFILEDLNTGARLSYQPDVMYYAASSIKAFYVASLAADYPQVVNAETDAMMRVILYSDNDAYEYLRNTYGKEYIRDWCLKAGVRTEIAEEMYPDYTARELAKLWAVNAVWFEDDEIGQAVSSWYESPNYSIIHPYYSDLDITTRTKAGWIAYNDGDEDLEATIDGGIVYEPGHPFLLVIMTDLPEDFDACEDLMDALAAAHDDMLAGTEVYLSLCK